jgi:ABC-type glycerol-3-phosphate transport system permease component
MTRRRKARSLVTTFRYAALLVGALVMVTPFIYMVSTSFKAQA